MEKLVRAMTELIACEVCGRPLDRAKYAFSDEDLIRLYKMSKAHDLAHLVGSALLKNDLVGNAEIRAGFEKQVLLAVYRCEKLGFELEHLCRALSQAKIPFMPLKGSVIRPYYPEAWMRTSCDIDILVSEADADAAAAILTESCGYAYHGKGSHDISLFSPDDIHIELHYDLVEAGHANAAAEVLKNIWDAAVLSSHTAYQYEMPDAYFYFYHIAHMAKHFVGTGGCGIRPFLDIWILQHRVSFDRAKRDALLSDGGLDVFAKQAERLAEVWFGDAAHTAITKQMEAFILRGGVYGTSTNRIAVQQQKHGGKLRYALSRVFIPYAVIKFHYPILQKHKWLTPIMEVRRWGKLIFCGHLKRSVNELTYNSAIPEDAAAETRALLENIGL